MYTLWKNNLFIKNVVYIFSNMRTFTKLLLILKISVLIYLTLCMEGVSLVQAVPLTTNTASRDNTTIANYNSMSSEYRDSSISATTTTTTKPYGILNDSLPMMLVSQVTPVTIQNKPKTKIRDRPLKCHCDICKDNNFICETDGYCFTSVQKETSGALIFSYRCMSVENHIPPDDPAWCHESTSESSIQCCQEDLCNTRENYAGTLPGKGWMGSINHFPYVQLRLFVNCLLRFLSPKIGLNIFNVLRRLYIF